MNEIVEIKEIAPKIKLLKLIAPTIAKKVLPGQFVVIRIAEEGERIPLTVVEAEPEKSIISIVFQEVGFTTKLLGKMRKGNYVLDILGPLGNPTEVKKFGKVLMVGGGVGIAELLPVARKMREKNFLIIIVGARNKDLLIFKNELSEISDKIYFVTDDGSYGKKGVVTDILKEVLPTEKPDIVYAVGPLVMMEKVSEMTRSFEMKTIVSLNPIMVDGTGMCGSCRVSVGGELKFACVDGPDFDAHLVDWLELRRRLNLFRDQEVVIEKRHAC